MLSHVCLGTNDLARALCFYDAVLATIGASRCAIDKLTGAIGYGAAPVSVTPLLFVGPPLDGAPATSSNGLTVALEAHSRETVVAWHDAALRHGGVDEGAPGLRPDYHPTYFAAYVRDPDGHKLCCVCHRA